MTFWNAKENKRCNDRYIINETEFSFLKFYLTLIRPQAALGKPRFYCRNFPRGGGVKVFCEIGTPTDKDYNFPKKVLLFRLDFLS